MKNIFTLLLLITTSISYAVDIQSQDITSPDYTDDNILGSWEISFRDKPIVNSVTGQKQQAPEQFAVLTVDTVIELDGRDSFSGFIQKEGEKQIYIAKCSYVGMPGIDILMNYICAVETLEHKEGYGIQINENTISHVFYSKSNSNDAGDILSFQGDSFEYAGQGERQSFLDQVGIGKDPIYNEITKQLFIPAVEYYGNYYQLTMVHKEGLTFELNNISIITEAEAENKNIIHYNQISQSIRLENINVSGVKYNATLENYTGEFVAIDVEKI